MCLMGYEKVNNVSKDKHISTKARFIFKCLVATLAKGSNQTKKSIDLLDLSLYCLPHILYLLFQDLS